MPMSSTWGIVDRSLTFRYTIPNTKTTNAKVVHAVTEHQKQRLPFVNVPPSSEED